MKKILFVLNVDWYFRLHWLARARACQGAGYEVLVACDFGERKIRDEFEGMGIRCFPIRLSRASLNPLQELISLGDIRRVIRQAQPDLVHTVTVKANLYAGFIATRHNIPLVSTVAGQGWAASDPGRKARGVKMLIDRLYRRIFRHAKTRMIFENGSDRDDFVEQELLSPAQASVIAGAGVDLDRFDYQERAKMRPGCLLFASRMLKSKGLDTLVAACDLLRSRGRELSLQVAGILDESQADALPLAQIEHWAERGKLEWLGQRDDMPRLIGEAVLVALPTRYGEGIPRILIEAAACGRALIATDVSGCREIVRNGENGILISVEAGIPAWADAIDGLMNDSDKAVQMGLAGRRLVEAEFSDAKICRETLELYEDLLAG